MMEFNHSRLRKIGSIASSHPEELLSVLERELKNFLAYF